MRATQLAPKRFVADSSFAVQIEIRRTDLRRVAILQLRDAHVAEDIVQDTMVAALQGEAGFTGKSSLKTWLTGILKHKIVDAIRNKTGGPGLRFARRRMPDRRFRRHVRRDRALGKPARRLELTITSTNLWVILYRARMALRQCLEQNWFAPPAVSSRGSAAGSHV